MENTKLLNFPMDDVIHDVIYLMNLGDKYQITNFVIFSKKNYVFIIT